MQEALHVRENRKHIQAAFSPEFLTQRSTPPPRAPQTANAFGNSSAFNDVFDPGAVKPELELDLKNVQVLRQTMTQQSNQLHAARRQCHVRSVMVYNQQIKIHELMLENSGLATDIASLSQTAVRNSYHAS